MELVECAAPRPGPGEVLIETSSIGVNFADVVVRLGLYPSAKKYVGWPIVPGFEFAGTIMEVGEPGSNETLADPTFDLRVGAQVLGVTRFGAYATHLVVPRSQVFPVPHGISMEHAGAIPVPCLTAYYALRVLGQAAPGKTVLVHSAAGGVGSMLVQMAKALGCFVVAVVGAAHKAEAVRGLGAERVIDKASQSLHEAARQAAPGGYDLVLDANGYETLRCSYQLLRPTGRLIVYGAHSMLSRGSARPNWLKLAWTFLRTPRFSPLDLTNDNKCVMAFNLSYLFEEKQMLAEAMACIRAWFESGQLRLPAMRAYPLQGAAQAHSDLQSGTTIGKLVLVP